jgi:hypothetical protein
MIYVGLGDKDRAFAWLDKAFAAHAWELPIIKAGPVFAILRDDARFPALLARLGLPE